MKSKRQSNIELLRIISMFLIVCNHFSIHGIDIKNSSLSISINKVFSDIVSSGGKLGAIIFIIISGYYLIQSQPSSKRIKSLLLTTWIYSISFFILQLLINPHSISFLSILQSIFPFLYNSYWFITAYILLIFFIPYINKLLLSLSRKEFSKLLWLSILLTLILPTIFPKSLSMMSEFIKFITFYMTGAYLRQFNCIWDNKRSGLYISILGFSFLILSIIAINYLGLILQSNSIAAHATYFSQNLSIIPFIIAVGLFILFKNIPLTTNPLINTISSTTLGIYLIHENIFVRNYIWNPIFNVKEYISDSTISFILIFLLSTITTFIVCSLIDYCRQIIFNKISEVVPRT